MAQRVTPPRDARSTGDGPCLAQLPSRLASSHFDRLARLAARSVRAPLAVFHLLQTDRPFHKTWIGLPGPAARRLESLLSEELLAHLQDSPQTLIVNDATRAALSADAARALGELGIAACVCMPLVSNGCKLGSLCVMDAAPRNWSEDELDLLADVAATAVAEIELQLDFAAQERREDALRESEARLRVAVRATGAAVWAIDLARGGVEYFDRRGCELLQIDPEQREWPPGTLCAHLHPEDSSLMQAAFGASMSASSEPVEYRVIRRDGEVRWLQGAGEPQRDAHGRPVRFVGVSFDITERKRIEQALREKEAFQDAILASAGVCVVAVDTGGRIISFNRTAERLTGYQAQDVVGRLSPLRLHEPSELAARARELSIEFGRTIAPEEVFEVQVRAGRTVTGEWTYVRKDGSTFPVQLTVTALRDGSGALLGFLGVAQDLTASKAVESALRESEAHLRIITDSTEAWLARINMQERYLFANRAFTQRAGMRRRSVIGRTVREVVGERAYGVLAPELTRALAGERVLFEGFVPYYAMGERYVRIEYIPERDPQGRVCGVVGVIVDLTERRRAEDALRESEARLATLTAALPALLFSTTADGRIDYVNDRFFEYSGIERDTPLAPAWQRIVHPEDLPRVLASWDESVRSGRDLNIECRLQRADGVFRWFKGYATQLCDERRGVCKWLGVALDIHDQKKAEAELQDANRRKNEFLAMLAHELRNPLAPIRNSAHILQMLSVGEPRLKTTTEMIGRQVNHMARLIDDLLDVARITQGKITLRRAPLELAPLLYNAVEAVRPFIDARGQELRIEAPPEPLYLEADATRLTQVVSNLLSNASKYTDAGGRIALSAKADGDEVVVCVSDNGIGIAPELMPHLFDPFTQSDRSLDRSQGGLGIGLSLVKRLVEMHGGRVDPKSAGLGQGSSFTVRLPALPAERMPRHLAQQPLPGAPPSATPLRVLVVDDNVDAEQSVSLLMRLEGHEVRAAHDGLEAVREAAAFRPDVVLLDIGLPGMTGYEVARRLREMPQARDAALVAVTGYGQAEDRQQALDAGFQHHLVKPVEPSALIQLIEGLARGRGVAATSTRSTL
jgi:PAS domain S-box-containing protein